MLEIPVDKDMIIPPKLTFTFDAGRFADSFLENCVLVLITLCNHGRFLVQSHYLIFLLDFRAAFRLDNHFRLRGVQVPTIGSIL